MKLEVLPESFAIARLQPEDPIPVWAAGGEFVSVTRTRTELSVVCQASHVPDGLRSEPGWRCLRVEGPLDFSLVGALASIAEPLAAVGVPIFCISTFDTDYVLVRENDLDRAVESLQFAGHNMAP